MKDETKAWLCYSIENLKSAKILLESTLFNPCLQNIQQTVEKSMKALLIEHALGLKKSHRIFELKNILDGNGIKIDLSDDDCDYLDTIYLPSKYPLASALPYFEPNEEICNKGIAIAEKVINQVKQILY